LNKVEALLRASAELTLELIGCHCLSLLFKNYLKWFFKLPQWL